MTIKRIFLNNLGLKILALLLALVTWIYVSEVTKAISGKTILQKLLSRMNYVSKTLYIKPLFVGKIPEGYAIKESDIKITPPSILVITPSKVLSDKNFIYTKPIDISEYTKTKTVNVELGDMAPLIKFEKTEVQIYLPVEKIIKEKTSE